MKITGIIAEFNPFHSGHEYLINKAMEETSSDACIVVMSGDFVQRGEPAFIDKYSRAEAALSSGCSMVIELGQRSATGSAAEFAEGAVKLLDSLGIVDTLSFGSESGDLQKLESICRIITDEPASYKTKLKENLSNGLSFPAARAAALKTTCGADEALLSGSNNILAIEYMKALRAAESRITPFTIKRRGEAYNSKNISETNFSSAKAIREAVISGNINIPETALCKGSANILKQAVERNAFLTPDDFSAELIYALRMNLDQLENFYDLSHELADRIRNTIDEFNSFTQYIELLKTKNLTYSAISRALTHVLLNISRDRNSSISDFLEPEYIHVLGFRKEASNLLRLIEEKASLPLIIRPTDAAAKLNKKALRSFNEEVRSANIYESAISRKSGQPFRNEFRRKVLVLK